MESRVLLSRSGRTRRMLQHASEMVTEGKHVIVMMVDGFGVNLARQHYNVHPNVQLETVMSLFHSFDWVRCDLVRPHDENVVFLIDHYVIEYRFRHILDRLHAYDVPTDEATARLVTSLDSEDADIVFDHSRSEPTVYCKGQYNRLDLVSILALLTEQQD